MFLPGMPTVGYPTWDTQRVPNWPLGLLSLPNLLLPISFSGRALLPLHPQARGQGVIPDASLYLLCGPSTCLSLPSPAALPCSPGLLGSRPPFSLALCTAARGIRLNLFMSLPYL